MIEYYPEIRLLHIGSVLLSGSIFTFRGLLMLAGSPLCNQSVLKRFSYLNDTVLLVAGLLLMYITRQYPVTHDWLSVKLSLLVVYIVLGVFALRAGRTRARRGMFFAAALAVFLFMFSVARTHHPLGIFAVV